MREPESSREGLCLQEYRRREEEKKEKIKQTTKEKNDEKKMGNRHGFSTGGKEPMHSLKCVKCTVCICICM